METAYPTTPVAQPGYVPKLLTGIDPLDRSWGGFYRGGSYLVYGRAPSGRDLIPLRFLQVGASLGESGLVISPSRPKDLMIQSASIGFNLRQAYEQGTVRLMRIPPVLNPEEDDDQGIVKAMHDLVAIIRQHRPQRLIINDFMPFVAFRSYDRLRTAFVEMLEQTDVLDMTMVLVMPQPANAQSSRVIDFMRSQMTGTVHVEMDADHPESTERRLVLMPNIGHLQRQTTEPWDLRDIVEDAPARTWRGSRRIAPTTLPEEPVFTAPAPPVPAVPDPPFVGIPPAAPAAPAAAPPPAPPAPPTSSSPTSFSPATSSPTSSYPVKAIPLGAARMRTASTPQRATPPDTAPPPPEPTPTYPTPVPLGTPRPAGRLDLSARYITSTEPERPPEAAAPAFDTAVSVPSSRTGFAGRLQAYFRQRAVGAPPFLLVAMRIAPEHRQSPFDFETISDIVSDALRPQDDVFIDAEAERLVAVLPDTAPEQQQGFFAGLKRRLREQVPQQADSLLQSVSAFVAPNGQPFSSADDFLSYVLDVN